VFLSFFSFGHKFEDTKGLIRKKMEGQTIQWPKEKGQQDKQ
jgi:hypothetical protein